MCGIAGIFGLDGLHREPGAVAADMGRALSHRGPDDEGVWIDHGAAIALVHRRLSIVDLSQSGHQPMHSHDGRFVITFNGEIYNYPALRRSLEASTGGITWRGHSDTEVLLEAIALWGLDRALRESVGMFAFALWDRHTRLLHLVRDRLGEKPLYYGRVGQSFVFSSELSCLRRHPLWRGEINRDAVALLMRHNCIRAPHSIFAGIQKLPPAAILTVSAATRFSNEAPRNYWSALAAASAGIACAQDRPRESYVEELETMLRTSVGRQMVADVPLGAFLSGGVDSSSVVALMQAQSARPVKTFSIGFHEDDYDEAIYARQVAQHLHTDHTELYVTGQDALSIVPTLPDIYDEPFADSSQIPTFLVAKLARQHVTVSLSGDGGDELFGGYNRYFMGRDIWRKLKWLPPFLRRLLASVIEAIPPSGWDSVYHYLAFLIPQSKRQLLFGDKTHKLAEVMTAHSSDEMYRLLLSHWKEPTQLVLGAVEPTTPLTEPYIGMVLGDPTQRMMLFDTITYLPDDILVKIDRATMAVSLESRLPFLDHQLVEFAWRVPLQHKITGNMGKMLLRELLYKYVPKALIERPKQGFSVPIDTWLRGPLRDWVEDFLAEVRLKRDGLLNPQLVRERWKEHLSGKRNWQYSLWCVLMLQVWLDRQRSAAGVISPA